MILAKAKTGTGKITINQQVVSEIYHRRNQITINSMRRGED